MLNWLRRLLGQTVVYVYNKGEDSRVYVYVGSPVNDVRHTDDDDVKVDVDTDVDREGDDNSLL